MQQVHAGIDAFVALLVEPLGVAPAHVVAQLVCLILRKPEPHQRIAPEGKGRVEGLAERGADAALHQVQRVSAVIGTGIEFRTRKGAARHLGHR